jgi:methylenetetrahydrofolate reductase (NADPH)
MALIGPGRYQNPYRPVTRDRSSAPLATAVERTIKGWLFGCIMCGNCILQETAFVCPMTCAKGLRNGPCGEAQVDQCVVDPDRACTWLIIFERAERRGALDKLLEVNAPIDGARAGNEQWLDLVRFWRERKRGPRPLDLLFNPERFAEEYNSCLLDYRQPAWWQGDAQYHSPAYEAPISLLEASLRSGTFVTTAEIATPSDTGVEAIKEKSALFKDHVTSANFADGGFATAEMGATACCKICLEAGVEPVRQIQGRDRSRLLLQAEALGAAALGIRNILCLGGDHQNLGPEPFAPPVQFDLDVVQALWILRRMRDEGLYLDGREIHQRPKLFLGAAASPLILPPKYEAIKIEKKVNAGAQFIQTQMVFHHDRLADWLEALDKRDLLEKVHILVGVLPLQNASDIAMFSENPGVVFPQDTVVRMQRAFEVDQRAGQHPVGDPAASKRDQRRSAQHEEGITLAVELIEKLKGTPGIKGIHLMVPGQEEVVPRIAKEAGLPKPIG